MNFNAVPANIQRYMHLLGYKPKHIAAIINMSERSLYRRFKNPGTFTLEEIWMIAKKFKVSFEKLLETA
jgi:hypothetical protein